MWLLMGWVAISLGGRQLAGGEPSSEGGGGHGGRMGGDRRGWCCPAK